MNNNKRLFQLGILIIALLAIGLAWLRISVYHQQVSPAGAANQIRQEQRRVIADLKAEEILGIDPQQSLSKEEKRALAVQRYARRPDLSIRRPGHAEADAFSARPYARPQKGVRGSFGAQSSAVSSYRPKGLSAADYGRYGSSSGSYTGGADGQQAGVYRPSVQEQMQAERERSFAPFMASVPKEQQKRLQMQLKGLSSGINRAVAKALLPKSKKDANIEKYLRRHASPEAAHAGPFAPVLEQVSAQKAGVVHSMGQAFGQEAAQEASKVMDSFQSEMAAVVNAPGQTSEQIAEKVQQVAQKYEQKLQKMSEDNGFKKFEQERIEKDNLLKQEISKQYGEDLAAQAGAKIDEFREKDMLLARQGLPPEQYYEQQLANQSERRKALEDLIAKSGKSTKGLMEAEDEVEKQEVAQRLKDEEEGKTLARSYKAGEKELAAIDKSLSQERQEKLQTAGMVYGEDGARRIDAVYQKYYDEYMKIWQNPDSSKTDKQQASMKLRQDVNKQLEQIQNDPQMQEARLNRQVDSSLAQIMKDPGLRGASAEQKAALQEKARPVLREMYEKVNEVVASDLPEAEKQKQIQQIQASAQQKLAGQ